MQETAASPSAFALSFSLTPEKDPTMPCGWPLCARAGTTLSRLTARS